MSGLIVRKAMRESAEDLRSRLEDIVDDHESIISISLLDGQISGPENCQMSRFDPIERDKSGVVFAECRNFKGVL